MRSKRKVFSENLQNSIKNSYLSQAQLAELCGVSRGSFGDWVHGRTFPRPEKLSLLAKALGISEYDLTTDFESERDSYYENHEVANIANELFNDAEARAIYASIARLEPSDRAALKQIISSLGKKNTAEED